MARIQYVIIIGFLFLCGLLVVKFIFYWEEDTEYRRVHSFISSCTTPVKNELADGLYRYRCDAGFYTSTLSPKKYLELTSKIPEYPQQGPSQSGR
ncbi:MULTISPECIES: hypothetical protein [Providencia]|nr:MULTISPECIES: hypothetical protein [Providencia]MBC5792308.1 hypothetical protein [Providencia sp. JUb39]